MDTKDLFTVKEVAKYLHIHEITVYRLLKQNKLPALRVGGQWRFDVDTVVSQLNAKAALVVSKPAVDRPRHKHIPQFLWRYFWDIDPKKIYLDKNSDFILERLLEYGDLDAIRWLRKNYSTAVIKEVVLKSRQLSPRSINYWHLVLNIKH